MIKEASLQAGKLKYIGPRNLFDMPGSIYKNALATIVWFHSKDSDHSITSVHTCLVLNVGCSYFVYYSSICHKQQLNSCSGFFVENMLVFPNKELEPRKVQKVTTKNAIFQKQKNPQLLKLVTNIICNWGYLWFQMKETGHFKTTTSNTNSTEPQQKQLDLDQNNLSTTDYNVFCLDLSDHIKWFNYATFFN